MNNWARSIAGTLVLTAGICGAVDAQAPPVEKLAFEVASIKRNTSVNTEQKSRTLPGGRIEVANMPLRTLVRIAYGLTGSQIVGGESWVASDGYDIVAKAPVDAPLDGPRGPSPQLMAMLRSLLEDRFQLRVHTEKRPTETYALILVNKDGRLGPELNASKIDCATPNACGIRAAGGDVRYTGLTIGQIATSVAGYPTIRSPIVDRTGLAGRYDLHLQFNDDTGPNVFTALAEQAGLKLQPEKGEAQFLVIDRAQRPTDD